MFDSIPAEAKAIRADRIKIKNRIVDCVVVVGKTRKLRSMSPGQQPIQFNAQNHETKYEKEIIRSSSSRHPNNRIMQYNKKGQKRIETHQYNTAATEQQQIKNNLIVGGNINVNCSYPMELFERQRLDRD